MSEVSSLLAIKKSVNLLQKSVDSLHERLDVEDAKTILSTLKRCSDEVNKVWSDEAREVAAAARAAKPKMSSELREKVGNGLSSLASRASDNEEISEDTRIALDRAQDNFESFSRANYDDPTEDDIVAGRDYIDNLHEASGEMNIPEKFFKVPLPEHVGKVWSDEARAAAAEARRAGGGGGTPKVSVPKAKLNTIVARELDSADLEKPKDVGFHSNVKDMSVYSFSAYDKKDEARHDYYIAFDDKGKDSGAQQKVEWATDKRNWE